MPTMDSDKPEPRKYVCWMDYPLGFPKQVWNIMWLSTAHIFGLHGVYMCIVGEIPKTMILFFLFYAYFSGTGTTVGCHRYWAHKTFKAKLPLQILLAFMQAGAAQYPIFKWCRDHRIHHKYVETDADPHDARRGFWYSHMGWLLVKEHPAVKEKEALIDLSDLDNDPVVRFQTQYYWYIFLVAVYGLPMSIQSYFWPQLTMYQLWCTNKVWYLSSLHVTWLVNSAAHMTIFGNRPYDKNHLASENRFVALITAGEGWHNYHHTFPWDYKAAELGLYRMNWSTMFIDFFAWLGWAYDLKTVPEHIVMARVNRTGDGSYANHHHHHHRHGHGHDPSSKGHDHDTTDFGTEQENETPPPWGWGDEDIPEEHFQVTQCLKQLKAL